MSFRIIPAGYKVLHTSPVHYNREQDTQADIDADDANGWNDPGAPASDSYGTSYSDPGPRTTN